MLFFYQRIFLEFMIDCSCETDLNLMFGLWKLLECNFYRLIVCLVPKQQCLNSSLLMITITINLANRVMKFCLSKSCRRVLLFLCDSVCLTSPIFTTAMSHNMQTSILVAISLTVDVPACGKVRTFMHTCYFVQHFIQFLIELLHISHVIYSLSNLL